MAAPSRSASTDFSSGSEGAAERQFYGSTTVLELICNDYQFSTCVLIFRHIKLSLSINVTMV
jgi:hypothetical protein